MANYSVINPFPVILSLSGSGLNDGDVYFGTAGQDPQTNPITVYWDAAGTQPASQPIATIGGYFSNNGTPAEVFAPSSYSMRVRDRFGVQVFYSANASGFVGALAATTGANLVGYSSSETYSSNTVGERLKHWDQRLGTYNFGVIQNTQSGVALNYSFSGNADGSADFRGWVDKLTATGSEDIDQAIMRNLQLELTHGSGATITRAFGVQAYGRLGLSGSTTGDVTSLRVYDTHIANEGSGTITSAACYFADAVDLGDGTGPIASMIGFASGDQGHATRVTSRAVGFSAGDMTGGAPLTAGFVSQVSSGTNKFAFYSEGSAPSVFTGSLTLGASAPPTDRLETYQGYAKFCGSTTKSQEGGCHELRTANSDWTVLCTSTHASTPQGIRMRFAGAAPNNTTQRFLYCDDTSADRLVIWSNGNVVNANNSYGAISDRRLKTKIKDARSQIDDIRKLRFRNYRLKSDPEHEQLGVVAQEAMKVSPGLVTEAGDDKHYQVNYSLLYLKAAKALQEAIEIIDDLQARVAKLERG